MDDILKPIIGLLDNPITHLFQLIGFSEALSKIFSTALGAFIIWLIGELLKKAYERFKNLKTARDLKPEFDYLTIKGFRDIFIPTRYARISPTRYDNPEEAYKHDEPRQLIPFMLNKSFNERVESEKFYLVLGDSGMGKTAFMVNLYMAFHSFFKFRYPQKMKLFRFQPPDIKNPVDVIDRIKAIKEDDAKNTILLLDGLDEDPFIISKNPGISDDQAFEKRLNDIISASMRFCDVVITCRTQYFPKEEKYDYVTTIHRSDQKGFYKLNKYYLFPFSDKEARKYLYKKYGFFKFWNWSKKKRAKELVNNSHKLMSRPMLMSYLDDLVKDEKKYQFSYQIYEKLIERWLIRESEKWRENQEKQEQFRTNLLRLARETALEIYQNWEKTGLLYLSKAEAIQIAQKHKIELKPDEVKGKSLLTCDPLLNWKFAHKSILEYFLALECVKDWEFASNFKFSGMDMAKHFYSEMAPPYENAINFALVKGGKFKMGDEHGDLWDPCRPVHVVAVSDFYIARNLVTQKQWREIMGNNPSRFKENENCPVENVSWQDVQQFIERLNAKTGQKFRLPTEAEWEYAARGGPLSPFEGGQGDVHIGKYEYAGSDNLDEVGWYTENSGGKTHPVATKKPNELGLYDMSGNVWEWCQDWFDEKYYEKCEKKGVVENPQGFTTGSLRVARGGCWRFSALHCRSAIRNCDDPECRDGIIGFRLVFVP